MYLILMLALLELELARNNGKTANYVSLSTLAERLTKEKEIIVLPESCHLGSLNFWTEAVWTIFVRTQNYYPHR